MGPTRVKIVRYSIEEYTHYCHFVARSIRQEVVMVRNNNVEIPFWKDCDWS